MNKQNPIDKKRKLIQQRNDNYKSYYVNDDDEDEQVKKTLNYFDSILDEYISKQDTFNENKIEKSYLQSKSTNGIAIQQNKKDPHVSLSLKLIFILD